MALGEREQLLGAYRAAVHAYDEAVNGLDENRFDEGLQRAEFARERAETARAALLKHELPGGLKSASVALFNIDTERWVLFENTECGSPPAGALAYAALPDHRQGEWIASPQEMNRERRNVKLYFTEAGLSILRKAGLEM